MAWKWHDSTLSKIEVVTNRIWKFFITYPKDLVFNFKPGQFVTMDLPISEKRLERWRSYSISGHNPDTNEIEFIISRVDGGAATTYLFDKIHLSDTIRFKGPAGAFLLPKDHNKTIVMICTGTGVAPFKPMIEQRLIKEKSKQPIHLIFGTRYKESLLYVQEFEELAFQFPNFQYTPCLSQEKDWTGVRGYVHQVYLNQYAESNDQTFFMLCGWSNMVDQAIDHIQVDLGYDKQQILYELYG